MRLATFILGLAVVLAALISIPAEAQGLQGFNLEPVGWVDLPRPDRPADTSPVINITRLGSSVVIILTYRDSSGGAAETYSHIITINVTDPTQPRVESWAVRPGVFVRRAYSMGQLLIISEAPSDPTSLGPGSVYVLRANHSGGFDQVYHVDDCHKIHVAQDLLILSSAYEKRIRIFKLTAAGEFSEVSSTDQYGDVLMVAGQKIVTLEPRTVLNLSGEGQLEYDGPCDTRSNPNTTIGPSAIIGSWIVNGRIVTDISDIHSPAEILTLPRVVNGVQDGLGYGVDSNYLQVIDIARSQTPYFLKAMYPVDSQAVILVDREFVYYATGSQFGVMKYTGGPAAGQLLNAEVVTADIPAVMTPGQSVPAALELRNLGISPWSGDVAFKLAVIDGAEHLLEAGASRVNIPEGTVVRRGETYTFHLPLRASDLAPHPGPVTLKLQMVQEWKEFFGPVIERTIQITEGSAAANWLLLE